MFIEPSFCLFILGGLFVFICIEGVLFLNRIQLVGIRRQGKIIGFESDHDGYNTPIIEFETLEGEIIEDKPYVSISTSLSRFRSYKNKIQKPVPILYMPNSPKKFVIESNEGYYYTALIFFGLIGTVLIVLGVCELMGIVNFS